MAKAKKLPSGNWRVNLFVDTDPVTGKRRYKSFTAPTKREAEYMAAEYKMGIQKRSVSEITLQEAMQRYIESQNALSPSTLRTYISMSKLAFKGVERCRLCDLTQEMIQKECLSTGKNIVQRVYETLTAFCPRCSACLPRRFI